MRSGQYAFTSPETRYSSGEDCVPNEGYGGFTIDVTRVFREAGEDEIHHTEELHTVYLVTRNGGINGGLDPELSNDPDARIGVGEPRAKRACQGPRQFALNHFVEPISYSQR